MPTRKQRRRRQKDRRHEYEYVYVDDEGREVEVDELEPARTPTPAKATKPAPAPAKGKGRQGRVPQPPSWSRSFKRSLPWGGLMLVLMLFLLRSQPLVGRVFFALLYALLFIPFTYWVDKIAWQRHQRQDEKKKKP